VSEERILGFWPSESALVGRWPGDSRTVHGRNHRSEAQSESRAKPPRRKGDAFAPWRLCARFRCLCLSPGTPQLLHSGHDRIEYICRHTCTQICEVAVACGQLARRLPASIGAQARGGSGHDGGTGCSSRRRRRQAKGWRGLGLGGRPNFTIRTKGTTRKSDLVPCSRNAYPCQPSVGFRPNQGSHRLLSAHRYTPFVAWSEAVGVPWSRSMT